MSVRTPTLTVNDNFQSNQQDYKLYVNNLPAQLDENGLRQLFGQYGKVLSLLSPSDSGWAFVSYGSYKEAELAIRMLDGVKPLGLHIEFARERISIPANQNRNRLNNDSNSVNEDYMGVTVHEPLEVPRHVRDFRYFEGKIPDSMLRKSPGMGMVRKTLPVNPAPVKYTVEGDFLYPVETTPETFQLYENPDRFYGTNQMWTRGHTLVTHDGRRHVSMGRGCTTYEIPEPHPRTIQYIAKVYETRRRDLYEYGKDNLENQIGRCQRCHNVAKFRCAICDTFYCNETCQRQDWPVHRLECQRIPALIRDTQDMNPRLSSSKVDLSKHDESSKLHFETNNKTHRQRLHNRDSMIETTVVKSGSSSPDARKQEELELSPSAQFLQHPSQESSIVITDIIKTRYSNNREQTSSYSSSTHETKDSAAQNIAKVYLPATRNENIKLHLPVCTASNDYFKLGYTDNDTDSNNHFSQDKHQQQYNFQKDNGRKLDQHIQNENNVLENHNKQITFSNHQQQKQIKNNVNSNELLPKDCKDNSGQYLSEECFAFRKDNFLQSNEFIPVVIISVLKNDMYWVQRQSDIAKVSQMMKLLQEKAAKNPPVKPLIGQTYALIDSGVWHRVLVMSLKPLLVRFIDYGEEKTPDNEDFRLLTDFKIYPNFARKILLVKDKNIPEKLFKENDVIFVKHVSINVDGTIFVQIQTDDTNSTANGTARTSNITTNSVTLPETNVIMSTPREILSIMDLEMKSGQEGFLEVHTNLRSDVFSVTLLPQELAAEFDKLFVVLPQICEQLQKNIMNYTPKLGEFVAGKRSDDDWIRGKVLSVGSSYKLAACDEGRVVVSNTVIPLPDDYFKINALAATCELIDNNKNIVTGHSTPYEVMGSRIISNEKIVDIIICNQNGTRSKAILKPWHPVPEQIGIPYGPLKKGSKVYITVYRNPCTMFLRCLDSNELERFNRMVQDVAKCAQTAEPLANLPVSGEMVIAKFKEDGNYYRAFVTDVKGEEIEITYVDFGNKEVTDLKYLLALPNEFKDKSSCVTKVTLKNVPSDVPMNKRVKDYLEYLIGCEKTLTCYFEGAPSDNGVELFTEIDSVNDKIQELLEPIYVKSPPEKEQECYTSDTIKSATLGKIGDTVNVIVLYTVSPGKEYFMCMEDVQLMKHVYEVMQPQIQEYVATTTSHYIPRENELCLAPFEGIYYRALCLIRSASPTTSHVFFIDFGNMSEVQHKDIRMMSKDFIEVGALGTICEVTNLLPKTLKEAPELPENLTTRLNQLVPESSTIKVKLMDYDQANAVYTIQMLNIKEQLVQEGLIQEP